MLVVDDHHAIRQGLRSLVGSYSGFTVVGEAADGEEACALAQQLRPDVILMDINMPRMNGVDATRHIKTRDPGIAIIGLSVNATSYNQEFMKQAGAALVLPKELALEELYSAIKDVVGRPHNLG